MDQRVVFLVLASKVPALRGLLGLLDERFRIIIHLDAKADPDGFVLPPHASFTDTRLPIFWGGFNIMLAVREMLDTAYRVTPGFRRAVLITGDTLPLLPPERLETALMSEAREHIHLVEVPNDPSLRGLTMQEAQRRSGGSILPWRFQNFTHLDDEMLSPRSRDDFMRKYGLGDNSADHLRGTAERVIATLLSQMPARPPLYNKLYYGESWWALSRSSMDLIIDDLHEKVHEEYFRFLQVPDEHFIQTLLGNKSRALSSLSRQMVGSPVFVDHSDPVRSAFGRDALTAEKFRAAAATGRYLFARKFDPELTPDLASAVANGQFFSDVVGF